tara:strand:+ start:787 stop:1299 length:513 start_codon:yes stop_codon:yes gene_type:complete
MFKTIWKKIGFRNGGTKNLLKILGALFLIAILFGIFKHNIVQAGECAAMMEGEENLKLMKEEHKTSVSTPEDGVVFAVCIFAVGEDGSRTLVDHRASDNLMDCLKNKRLAERDYKDPEKRKKYSYSPDAVFMMTCDKVNAKIRIREDGTWEILDITGRHEPAYKKKKSYE